MRSAHFSATAEGSAKLQVRSAGGANESLRYAALARARALIEAIENGRPNASPASTRMTISEPQKAGIKCGIDSGISRTSKG